MFIPGSTYRIQLNKEFTLQHLEEIIEYLHKLGITTIYAAPILESKEGSMHGYDVTDPLRIDSEIGTKRQLLKLKEALHQRGMSWLQDIVPNHMAFNTGNTRLMDVLERGSSSPYYNFFDIDWNHPSPSLKGKLCVPFLGKELDESLRDGEMRINFSNRGFTIDYFDTSYPLSVSALSLIDTMPGIGDILANFINSSKQLSDLKSWAGFKAEWAAQYLQSGTFCNLIDEINSDTELLKKIVNAQYYLLMYWKRSEKEINYRRFFTVNELICLRMENKDVFYEYHQLTKSLYDEKIIQGIRIDHIDGLYDPAAYVQQLRQLMGEECYIIAEKILEAKEQIPDSWELQGTSGYEFLSFVNQLITDRSGASRLTAFYRTINPILTPYQRMVSDNKRMILENYMAGEWENLVVYFERLDLLKNFNRERIKKALGVLMISFPIYRIYPDTLPLSKESLGYLEEALKAAHAIEKELTGELEYLGSLFISEQEACVSANALLFLKRMMQFTGPLTAKGVEDTTFYIYNPLISHDEVGDVPSTLGISIDAFHSKMLLRRKNSPCSLNATATHDTKRGEDARIRLNVISEIPDLWQKLVREWMLLNTDRRINHNGKNCPTTNDEYFIYQSLIGGFPIDLNVDESFLNRFREFLTKALREAKVNSNWSQPDTTYEEGCITFVQNILQTDSSFRRSFDPFVQVVTRYASIYTLGQVLIKITAPGIPDIYQGCDLWDLSYVDPDNRRPVDYKLRMEYLQMIDSKGKEGADVLLNYLRANRQTGLEKMFVTARSLNYRRTHEDLFINGEYIPLRATGKDTVVVAYARRWKQQWAIVVVPLALARNNQLDQPYSDDPDEKRAIPLPDDVPNEWFNIFTGEKLNVEQKLLVFDALKDFPVALLVSQQ